MERKFILSQGLRLSYGNEATAHHLASISSKTDVCRSVEQRIVELTAHQWSATRALQGTRTTKASPAWKYLSQGGKVHMPAYVIAQLTITDPQGFEEYRNMVPATIAQYGGKYVVRSGNMEKLEGDWEPQRLVIIEFESAERAKEWWACEEYREAKALRQRTAKTNLIIVEGV